MEPSAPLSKADYALVFVNTLRAFTRKLGSLLPEDQVVKTAKSKMELYFQFKSENNPALNSFMVSAFSACAEKNAAVFDSKDLSLIVQDAFLSEYGAWQVLASAEIPAEEKAKVWQYVDKLNDIYSEKNPGETAIMLSTIRDIAAEQQQQQAPAAAPSSFMDIFTNKEKQSALADNIRSLTPHLAQLAKSMLESQTSGKAPKVLSDNPIMKALQEVLDPTTGQGAVLHSILAQAKEQFMPEKSYLDDDEGESSEEVVAVLTETNKRMARLEGNLALLLGAADSKAARNAASLVKEEDSANRARLLKKMKSKPQTA